MANILTVDELKDRIKWWYGLDNIRKKDLFRHIEIPTDIGTKPKAAKYVWDMIEQYHSLCEWSKQVIMLDGKDVGGWVYGYKCGPDGMPNVQWQVTEEQWRRTFQAAMALHFAWTPSPQNYMTYHLPGFVPPGWASNPDRWFQSWYIGVWRQQYNACWECLDELMFEMEPAPSPDGATGPDQPH